MYYPYFRGKQYELVALRESVETLREAGFTPVVEPVKESTNGLVRTIKELDRNNVEAVLIVNPSCGDLYDSEEDIEELVRGKLDSLENLSIGLILTGEMGSEDVFSKIGKYYDKHISLIHNGFTDAKGISPSLYPEYKGIRNIFVEEMCGKLYQRHFKSSERILVRDGFKQRANRNHPYTEFFSDLHATYGEEGMDGFGDYLIVGDNFSETGGPAYAVAIHLTYIDPGKDDTMHIFHFVSDEQATPKDPAKKFQQALEKLVSEVTSSSSNLYRTSAIKEFLDLHRREHFPGLGYVKKLSMIHHMETLARYFE